MTQKASRTVLVVEDEPLVRFAIAEVAQGAGFSVYEASAAAHALAILERSSCIDIVVTDIQLPGATDGLLLSQVIRERWPSVRLLITSGFALPSNVSLPADARFIGKPFRAEALVSIIEAMI